MNELPQNDNYPESPAPLPENKNMRLLVWGGTAVAVAFITLVVGLFWRDPLGWSLLARFAGRPNLTLTAVPQESILYVGASLSAGNLAELAALRETFASSETEYGAELDDALQEINEGLVEDFGIVFAEDVQPWLGHHVGFAVVDLTIGEYGMFEEGSWLLVAESRDVAAADAFLTKLAVALAEERANTATTETYGEVTITSIDAGQFDTGLALAQSDRLVLIGTSVDVLQLAIDAQSGASMANSEDFQAAVAGLPAQRFMTVYLDGSELAELSDSMMGLFGTMATSTTGGLATAGTQGTAVSLTFVDAGIRIDSINSFDPDEIPEYQRELMTGYYAEEPASITFFPEDTVMYMGVQGTAAASSSYQEIITAQTGAVEMYEEMMEMWEQQLGIDLETDFFSYVGNEFAFGLMPDGSGMFADSLDINLGAVLLVGVAQETEMAATLEAITGHMTDPTTGGMVLIDHIEGNGLTLYELGSAYSEATAVAYGIGQGYLLIGTSATDLQSLQFGGGTSLADNSAYQEANAALPREMTPFMYLDMEGMVEVVRDGMTATGMDMAEFDEGAAVIRPLRAVAAAVGASETSMHQTFVLFIDKE